MATTTPEAIRDRMLTVIEALTPSTDTGVRFRRYRNEGGANFRAWCEANPAGARRRFQVRTVGLTQTPAVSNTDIEEHQVEVTIIVAYPWTARDGAGQALDRDDTADVDQFQIDKAVGMLGKANFSPPYPDTTWLEGVPGPRVEGESCDFVELRYVMFYKRARMSPVASFTFDSYFLDATFTDDSYGGGDTIAAWLWNFGDGNTSTLQNPTHAYAVAGTYSVTLTVTGNGGLRSSPATSSVEVNAPPGNLVVIVGQSNAVGFGQSFFVDPGLAVDTAFPAVQIHQQIGTDAVNPLVWTTYSTRDLQPYTIPDVYNMGVELSLGRALYAGGMTNAVLAKFAIGGAGLQDHFLNASYPSAGPSLYDQLVAYIQARLTEFDTTLGAIVWIQGEQDATNATQAGNYAANLTTLVTNLRAEFGDFAFVYNKLNTNTPYTHKATLRTQQDTYLASDANARMVNVDDLPLGDDNVHYSGANGTPALITLGDRLAVATLEAVGYEHQAPTGTAPYLLGGDAVLYGAGALSPRWGGPVGYEAGDVALLFATTSLANAAITLLSAAGFQALGNAQSVWSGSNYSNLYVWWCRADQATMDANSGHMPTPTVADSNAYNAAGIVVIRRAATSGTPVELISTGQNNAFSAPLSIPGGTPSVANELIVQAMGAYTSARFAAFPVVNADLTDFAVHRRSVCQIQSGQLQDLAIMHGTKAAATAFGATTATLDWGEIQAYATIGVKP